MTLTFAARGYLSICGSAVYGCFYCLACPHSFLVFQDCEANVISFSLQFFRRQKTRRAVFTNMGEFRNGDDEDFDILETLESLEESEKTESAEKTTSRAQILQQIEVEINQLPTRQREAFLMRYWEEMDVAETAAAMGCSEGSVKTHCSRAVQSLSKALTAKGISLNG